jgi:hypothetical protein
VIRTFQSLFLIRDSCILERNTSSTTVIWWLGIVNIYSNVLLAVVLYPEWLLGKDWFASSLALEQFSFKLEIQLLFRQPLPELQWQASKWIRSHTSIDFALFPKSYGQYNCLKKNTVSFVRRSWRFLLSSWYESSTLFGNILCHHSNQSL